LVSALNANQVHERDCHHVDQELIIDERPDVTNPVLIAGFEGWANGGNVAVGVIDFLKKKLDAVPFARIDPDSFYRFDDVRPTVKVAGGRLEEVTLPEAAFYVAREEELGVDLILFKSHEPHFKWSRFTETLLSLCKDLEIKLIISLGGLQDSVVHTDTIISGFASNETLMEGLKEHEIIPAEYEGPGAIHSLIFQQAERIGIEGVSLWGHCPFYLQGTHLRLLSKMVRVLADIAGFEMDTGELDKGWTQLARSIQRYIDGNPELQKVIGEIVRAKTTTPPEPHDIETHDGKVIYLDDFFRPKE
jgi:proteasome assembly chaperone (PAC2) family protein